MGGLEPPTSRTMRSPLFQLSYISLCFSDCPTVNGISNKPFPMGCLSIVASSFCSSIDIIGFCTTASMQIQLNHRPPVYRQRNSNQVNTLPEEYLPELPTCGIEPPAQVIRTGTPCFSWQKLQETDLNRRSQGYEPCEIPLLYPAINPDSRVSKVFNVLCLNTRRFGLRQYRLYGRAPLHGLNFTVQLYTHKEVCRHALAAMIRVGNCIRFSTSCFLCWLNTAFSTKDTHLLKERRKIMKKCVYVKYFYLRIFPMNTFYHRTSKKLWYMF